MLTYLVASFVGFLHQHPPLVVQLHGHAAAAVRVLAHPAEELLQLPAHGGVGVGAGLGVAGARHQSLWGGGGGGRAEGGGGGSGGGRLVVFVGENECCVVSRE